MKASCMHTKKVVAKLVSSNVILNWVYRKCNAKCKQKYNYHTILLSLSGALYCKQQPFSYSLYFLASFPVSTPSFFSACCKKHAEKKLGVETGNESYTA